MLFIIDMQNKYLDEGGEDYIKGAKDLVPLAIKRIKEYEKKNHPILYTLDIEIKPGKDQEENNNDSTTIKKGEDSSDGKTIWANRLYPPLEPYLKDHKEVKKTYYALPPKSLLEIQEAYKDKKEFLKEIEFIGVETNICVLANAICIQSAFPDSKIIINSSITKSRDLKNHSIALKTMKALGMEII